MPHLANTSCPADNATVQMSSEAAAPRPTAETERLDILDALRGFALGGILLLNLASFSGVAFMSPEMMAASPPPPSTSQSRG